MIEKLTYNDLIYCLERWNCNKNCGLMESLEEIGKRNCTPCANVFIEMFGEDGGKRGPDRYCADDIIEIVLKAGI